MIADWTPMRLRGRGLWGWWDASYRPSLTLNGSGRVVGWRDRVFGRTTDNYGPTGFPPVFSQPTTSGRPGVLGESGCLIVTGTYDDLSINGEVTVVCVARTAQTGTPQGNAGRLVSFAPPGAGEYDYQQGQWILIDDYTDPQNRVALWGDVTNRVISPVVSPDRPHVISMRIRNEDVVRGYLRVNGGAWGSATMTGTIVSSGMIVLLNSLHDRTGNWLRGELHEVMVFNRALSDTDIARVEQYAAAKWRLPLTLGRPYGTNRSDTGWATFPGDVLASRLRARDVLGVRAQPGQASFTVRMG